MKKFFAVTLALILCISGSAFADLKVVGVKDVSPEKAIMRIEVNESTGWGSSKHYEYTVNANQNGAKYNEFVFEKVEVISKEGDLNLKENLLNGDTAVLKFKLSKKFFENAKGSCKLVLTMVKGNGITDNNTGSTEGITREWTIIGYWAADNNLDSACEGDIKELLEAKSDASKAAFVLQIDREKKETGRYVLDKGKLNLVEKMPEINTGDPKVLLEFIKWAMQKYPAKKYMLELWGHGSGWVSLSGPGTIGEKSYGADEGLVPMNGGPAYTNSDEIYRMLANDPTISGSYNTGVKDERSFGYDDSPGDCITMKEFREEVLKKLNKKFDIIGFDCCLMNNLEIGYELKDYTDNLIAAVTTFPGMGYYYTGIAQALYEQPTLNAEGLANAIYYSNKMFYEEMKKYVKENAAQIQQQYNMSADQFIEQVFKLNFGHLKLNKIGPVMSKLNAIAPKLAALDKGLIRSARSSANGYGDLFGEQYGNQYTDLYELIKYVEEHTKDAALKSECSDLRSAIEDYEEVFYYSLGSLKNGHISIYFPAIAGVYNFLDKYYQELNFYNASKWNDFLKVYFK